MDNLRKMTLENLIFKAPDFWTLPGVNLLQTKTFNDGVFLCRSIG